MNLSQHLLRNVTSKLSDAMQKSVMEIAQMNKSTLTVDFLLLEGIGCDQR